LRESRGRLRGTAGGFSPPPPQGQKEEGEVSGGKKTSFVVPTLSVATGRGDNERERARKGRSPEIGCSVHVEVRGWGKGRGGDKGDERWPFDDL